jgi:hypothetical protein
MSPSTKPTAPQAPPCLLTSADQSHHTARTFHESLNDKQRNVMLEYMFQPGPYYRAPAILSAADCNALSWCLSFLNEHIPNLIDLDQQLHRQYVALLSPRKRKKDSNKHLGFGCKPVSRSILRTMGKSELEDLLLEKLAFHDKVAESVRKWKGELDKMIGRRYW